jgi:hypothetical protein
VSFASVYVDESGSHEGSPILCLAGFLYEDEHGELLDKAWRALLAREGLPYIRMSLFAAGKNPPFDHLSKEP